MSLQKGGLYNVYSRYQPRPAGGVVEKLGRCFFYYSFERAIAVACRISFYSSTKCLEKMSLSFTSKSVECCKSSVPDRINKEIQEIKAPPTSSV